MVNFNFDIISVALDLGSSMFKAAAGYKDENSNKLVVIATEEEPACGGVKEGVVDNLQDASFHISRLLKKLENRVANIFKQSNCFPEKHTMSIDKVYVNISAGRTQGTMSTIERHLGNSEILQSSIDGMNDENGLRCKAINNPNFAFYTALPSRYLVDGVEVKKPVGMIGEHIVVEYQNIWIKKGLTERVIECLKKVGVENCEFILSAKSISDIVLSQQEKEDGVVLVNFGDQVTSVSVFKNTEMKYLVELPKGSGRITDDIAELQIPRETAKRIKEQSCAVANWEEQENFHETINGAPREFERWVIANIVEKRMEALFTSVAKAKEQTVWGKNAGLVVLTGGGSNLRFCAQKAQEVLGVNVRLGDPNVFKGRKKQERCMASVFGSLLNNGGHSLRFTEIVEQKPVEETTATAEEPKEKKKKKKGGFMERLLRKTETLQRDFVNSLFSEDTSKESDKF